MSVWFILDVLVICLWFEQENMEKNKLDHAEEIQRLQKDHTLQLEVNLWMWS